MPGRALCFLAACYVLFVGCFSGCASENDFECEACKGDKNCSRTDPSDRERYSTNVTECPSGICYVMFGTFVGWALFSGRTETPLVTLGCTKPHDADVPAFDQPPFGAPPYAPLPPPENKPGNEEFVCRKNGAPYKEDKSDNAQETIESSMSCFCFAPRCQRELKVVAASRLFRANLVRSLPVEGTGWVIVDRLGVLKAETGNKKYSPFKPDADMPVKFSCGQCPCEAGEDCPRFGHHNCTREGPALYTVETSCETEQCYLIFGIMEVYTAKRDGWRVIEHTAWRAESYVARGCSQASANEYENAKKAVGNPLYYAWPPPEPVPGPGQWACRRNPPHEHHLSTVTCFCFTSMCQAGYNPNFDQFRNNVHSNLPLGNYWVIVDSEGRKTEVKITTPASAATYASSNSAMLVQETIERYHPDNKNRQNEAGDRAVLHISVGSLDQASGVFVALLVLSSALSPNAC